MVVTPDSDMPLHLLLGPFPGPCEEPMVDII
jgi:hypothetical protein